MIMDIKKYSKAHCLPRRKIQADIIAEANPEWKERIRENWWEDDNIRSSKLFLKQTHWAGENVDVAMDAYKQFLFLHNVLLAIGGSETCFPVFEDDMEAILARGRYFHGRSRMMKGQPSQCHRNSCELWKLNHEKHDVSICTGYALSEDGMWRQHSWLLLIESDGREIIIETTKKRKAYYGFIMNDEEAYAFVEDNF